jgi:hypothetical protein
MPDVPQAGEELLRGAVCYHSHTGWLKPPGEPCRPLLDPIRAVRDASAAGLAAVVLRDLNGSSVSLAQVLSQLVPRITIVGGLTLNAAVGGINPEAVEAALTSGRLGRFVCFPTDSSSFMARLAGVEEPAILAERTKYASAVVDGVITAETKRVLELIAEHDVLLETGLLDPRDTLTLLREANALGVTRMVVTHPSTAPINMSMDAMLEAVDLGAFIEFAFAGYTHHVSYVRRRYPLLSGWPSAPASLGEATDQIRVIGPRHCVVSTDFGQPHQASPVEGLREFMYCLLDLGVSRDDIALMARENPLRLLGISPD